MFPSERRKLNEEQTLNCNWKQNTEYVFQNFCRYIQLPRFIGSYRSREKDNQKPWDGTAVNKGIGRDLAGTYPRSITKTSFY